MTFFGGDLFDLSHCVQHVKASNQSSFPRSLINDFVTFTDQLDRLAVSTFLSLNGLDAGDVQSSFVLQQTHCLTATRRRMLPCIAGKNDAAVLLFRNFEDVVHRPDVEQTSFVDPEDLVVQFGMQFCVPN